MVKRNPHIAKLQAGYLFPEIVRRKQLFFEKHPEAQLISLGIGDTTQPLPALIVQRLVEKAQQLGTKEGYSGYGPEEGESSLRAMIAQQFYSHQFEKEEIFISDGTNCDIGRLQVLFGNQVTLAVQDPSYPVYIDTGVMVGQTDHYDSKTKQYQGICYLPCAPENDFFPDLSKVPPSQLIYFCSPNNPTGAVATHEQLEKLVAYAKQHHAMIIYDTAYAAYIQDPSLPRSIYEVKGAEEVAIELGSFSKMAGFTGVRLAWSVVPKSLRFEDGSAVLPDWRRVHTTFFNGASNLSQAGGMVVLSQAGKKSIQELVEYYMKNAKILKKTCEELGLEVYGGTNAPYVWIKTPRLTSWQAFDLFLEKAHLITAPGSGFGPNGEHFLRLSAFAQHSQIEEAVRRLHALKQDLT